MPFSGADASITLPDPLRLSAAGVWEHLLQDPHTYTVSAPVPYGYMFSLTISHVHMHAYACMHTLTYAECARMYIPTCTSPPATLAGPPPCRRTEEELDSSQRAAFSSDF